MERTGFSSDNEPVFRPTIFPRWIGWRGVGMFGMSHRHLCSRHGFTLIELVMVILVLGILSAVAIPVIGSLFGSSEVTVTREEMRRLAVAISGSDPTRDRGYEGDVGYLPGSLADLVSKPDSVAAWNAYQHVGWNGPYIDGADSEYLTDAWGTAYIYNPSARTIASVGSGDTITITF